MRKRHVITPMIGMGLLVVAILIALVPNVLAQQGATLQVEPGKGTYGLQIFLKGSGFAPNSQIQIQAFGQVIAPQADSTGSFMVLAFAPTDQAKFKPGPLNITAKDSAGNSAEATFTLEELVIAPVPGQVGTPAKPAAGGSVPAASNPAADTNGTGSTGLLIGVVVAAVIALAVLVFAVVFFSTRHKQKALQRPPEAVRPGLTVRPATPAATMIAAKAAPVESALPKAPAAGQESETTLVMPSLPKLSSRPTLQIIRGEGEGDVYTLEQKTTVLGRGEDCDVVINHPMVSRHHAKIVRVGPSFYIHDLQSTNSTLVNGQRIDQHVLQSEDEIQIGVTLLLFQQPPGE